MKTRRRLGVSSGRTASNGPAMSTLSTSGSPRRLLVPTKLRRNGRAISSDSAAGRPTNEATISWRPAVIGSRTRIDSSAVNAFVAVWPGFCSLMTMGTVGVLAADGEQGDPLAVQRQLDLMRLADPADGAHRGPPQPHADLVLGVDRKVLRDPDAAPGAERQVAQVVVLRQVLGRLAGDCHRRDRRAADGQPADLARRRDGALDEQRRHPQGVRDVCRSRRWSRRRAAR